MASADSWHGEAGQGVTEGNSLRDVRGPVMSLEGGDCTEEEVGSRGGEGCLEIEEGDSGNWWQGSGAEGNGEDGINDRGCWVDSPNGGGRWVREEEALEWGGEEDTGNQRESLDHVLETIKVRQACTSSLSFY